MTIILIILLIIAMIALYKAVKRKENRLKHPLFKMKQNDRFS